MSSSSIATSSRISNAHSLIVSIAPPGRSFSRFQSEAKASASSGVSMSASSAPRWKTPYAGTTGLAAVHNSSAFGDAVYVAASESQDPQVRRLAPLAAGLLKSLP